MPTTHDDIRRWLDEAKRKGASHMIVATDTYDWEDYPVFVMSGTDPVAEIAKHEKVMECYRLASSWEDQLTERRAFHTEP